MYVLGRNDMREKNINLASTLYRKSDLCIPEMKFRGLVPNSYIHVYVKDLYIPRISLPIWLQQTKQTDPEKYINRS
jgi:hypothetical protein